MHNIEQVFCTDCDELLQLVLHERGLNPHECDVHVGFDGGQGILKIGFTVTERESCGEENPGRSKYSQVICGRFNEIFVYLNQYFTQGVAPKTAKLSSVKKLIVLGAVPDVPENYFNVKIILDELNMEALEYTTAADIKMRRF